MIRRISFAVIALFWVTMNALLWRAEFSGEELAASVPGRIVWEKVLTAPDDSSLSINFQGKKLGYLRVRPRVGEGTAEGKILNENEPEGFVRRISGYNLEVDGNLVAQTVGRSVRFNGEFAFGTDMRWQRFRTRTFVRPYTWEVKGSAGENALWVQAGDGTTEWIQRFTPEDLRNPQRLATVLESPAVAVLLSQLLPAGSRSSAPLSLGLEWKARHDWLQIGHNRVRIYRLEAKLLDRHKVVVLISRVGEILRVELPGDFKLVNDILYAS